MVLLVAAALVLAGLGLLVGVAGSVVRHLAEFARVAELCRSPTIWPSWNAPPAGCVAALGRERVATYDEPVTGGVPEEPTWAAT